MTNRTIANNAGSIAATATLAEVPVLSDEEESAEGSLLTDDSVSLFDSIGAIPYGAKDIFLATPASRPLSVRMTGVAVFSTDGMIRFWCLGDVGSRWNDSTLSLPCYSAPLCMARLI